MKKIAILGSTGSIGTQTLEIIRNNEDLSVVALAAGRNVELMARDISKTEEDYRTYAKQNHFVNVTFM